jgi:hypothetical protein
LSIEAARQVADSCDSTPSVRRSRRPAVPKLPTFAVGVRTLVAGALCFAAVISPAQGRDVGPADAAQVKAAFILNFLKFVEWPDPVTPGAPITIAVVGDEELGAVLTKTATGQSLHGRTIEVRPTAHVADRAQIHLLFIGGSQVRNLSGILRTVEGRPVLTVGDTAGYGHAGVILNLYTFNQRVGIEANTTAAARAGLRLSSQLLRLARIVG